jgi:hypothetical protein
LSRPLNVISTPAAIARPLAATMRSMFFKTMMELGRAPAKALVSLSLVMAELLDMSRIAIGTPGMEEGGGGEEGRREEGKGEGG